MKARIKKMSYQQTICGLPVIQSFTPTDLI